MTDKEKLDAILAEDAANNNEQPQEEQPKNEASQYLGTSLTHNPATGKTWDEDDSDKNLAKEKGLSRIGEEIGHKADIRDGWIDVNKELLGERAIFYPESWQFRIIEWTDIRFRCCSRQGTATNI